MNKDEFLTLMKFPSEWKELDMIPEELIEILLVGYESGHEDASEHDRNGAFHWWLTQEPTESQLKKLMFLASIDSESLMGNDVRQYIEKAKNFSPSVAKCWGKYE